MLHLPLHLLSPAGNQDYRSLVASLANPVRRIDDMKSLRYGDFVERGYVIALGRRSSRNCALGI